MPQSAHIRCTVSGVINNTSETWSWTFSLNGMRNAAAGGVFTDRSAAGWGTMNSAIRTFHNTASTKIAQSAQLTQVKFAALGTDGKYLDLPILFSTITNGAGSLAPPYPTQVSLAVSIHSAGVSPLRGRFYLPCPTAALASDGLISTTDRDNIQTNAKTMLDAINAAARGMDSSPSGAGVVISSTKGYLSTVSGVRVGRRLDILRSRGKQTSEVFTAGLAVV